MTALKQKIRNWQKASLISDSQAEQILAYEEQLPKSQWLLFTFLALGFFVLATGVIALVAANWQDIPAVVKLSVDFIILFAFAGLILYTRNKATWVYECSLLLFILLVMASIGLISQIYQLGGSFDHALVFWGIICFPVILYANSVLTTLIWAVCLFTASYFRIADATGMLRFFADDSGAIIAIAAVPFITSTVYLLCKRFGTKQALLHALYWSCFISFIIAIAWADLLVTQQSWYAARWRHPEIFSIIFASSALAVFITMWFRDRTLWQKSFISVAIISAMLLYLCMFHLDGFRIVAPVLSIIAMLALMFYFAAGNRVFYFNLIALMIGLRFILVYITELGGLAKTGIGLVITGLIIILMVSIWHRYHQRLSAWMMRVST